MVSTVEDVLIEDTVMVNQINDAANIKVIDTDNRMKAKAQVAKEKQAPAAEQAVSGDSVSLSNASKQLDALKASFADIPEVDSIRVSYFKAEIAAGNYQINNEQIANKMLNNVETA